MHCAVRCGDKLWPHSMGDERVLPLRGGDGLQDDKTKLHLLATLHKSIEEYFQPFDSTFEVVVPLENDLTSHQQLTHQVEITPWGHPHSSINSTYSTVKLKAKQTRKMYPTPLLSGWPGGDQP